MEDKRKHLFANSVYAVKTIFKYAPVVSTIYTVTALASGFFTPVSIYFLQRLIDSITAYINNGVDIGNAALWGGLYVFSLFGIESFWFIQPKIGRFMNRKLRNSLSPAVIEKFIHVEYHYFEEQHFRDVVARVGNRPQQSIIYFTFFCIVDFIVCLIRFFGILTLFFTANLWIGIGVALINIPIIILSSNATDKKNRLLRDSTTDQRMGEYLQNLFTDKHSAFQIMPIEITVILLFKLINALVAMAQVYITANLFDTAGKFLEGATDKNMLLGWCGAFIGILALPQFLSMIERPINDLRIFKKHYMLIHNCTPMSFPSLSSDLRNQSFITKLIVPKCAYITVGC